MGRVTAPPATLMLRLYVAGAAPNSLLAARNLRAVCEGHFANAYELEVVDLLLEPARAMHDRVVVTPTLVKLSPAPPQKLIGTLGDAAQLLMTLRGA